jgi:hypothetical protein
MSAKGAILAEYLRRMRAATACNQFSPRRLSGRRQVAFLQASAAIAGSTFKQVVEETWKKVM